jgi:hypothetical protein
MRRPTHRRKSVAPAVSTAQMTRVHNRRCNSVDISSPRWAAERGKRLP